MANSLYEALIGLNQGQHKKNLLNSLYGVQTEPEETLPGQVAQTIGAYSPYVVNPYMSTKQALGVGLGTALLGGISSFLGARQAANENVKNRALLVKALGATSPDELRDIIAQDTSGKVTPVAYELYSKNLEKQAEEEKAKQKLEQEFAIEALKKGISTPLSKKILGVDIGPGAQLSESLTPTEAPKFGEYKPYSKRRNEIIKEGIGLGLTPNKASEEADKRLAQETSANKAILSKIEKSREEGSKLQALTATAEEGRAGAGETGGILAGPRELASLAYQILPTAGGREEAQQRAATKLLDSIRPEIVKANRSPGAVSDFENKMIIGAGPSSANTPTENRVLIDRMKHAASLENEYADFLEQFMQDKGDAVGADKLWNEYKNDVVFKGGQYNPDRTSWEDYFKNVKLTKDNKIVKLGEPSESPAEKKNRKLKAELAKLEELASKQAGQ